MIANLKEKQGLLEKENKNLKAKAETLNEQLNALTDDLSFYKSSCKEQKDRVNREHELISTSLYELAMQFMSLKNELQKKINPDKAK